MKQPQISNVVCWFGDTNLNQKPAAAIVTDVSGQVVSLSIFPPGNPPLQKASVYHAQSEGVKKNPNLVGRNGVWEWPEVVEQYQAELRKKEEDRRLRLEAEREEALTKQAEETKEKLLRKQVIEKHLGGMDLTAICQSLRQKKDVVEKILAEFEVERKHELAVSPQ